MEPAVVWHPGIVQIIVLSFASREARLAHSPLAGLPAIDAFAAAMIDNPSPMTAAHGRFPEKPPRRLLPLADRMLWEIDLHSGASRLEGDFVVDQRGLAPPTWDQRPEPSANLPPFLAALLGPAVGVIGGSRILVGLDLGGGRPP